MSLLDGVLLKVVQYLGSNSGLPTRPFLNFKGSGVSVADNATNNSTDVTIVGGSGIASGDVSVSGTASTLVSIRGVTTPSVAPWPQQALVASSPSVITYTDVETVIHVDEVIANTTLNPTGQVTSGIQAALTLAASLSPNPIGSATAGAHIVQFSPKLYGQLTAQLVLLSASAMKIRGAGSGQTVLYAPAGVSSVLRLTNCEGVVIQDIAFVAPGATFAVAAGGASGTTIHIGTNTVANGSWISLISTGLLVAETVQISSGGGTSTLTTATTLRNTYVSGDYVRPQALVGVEMYADNSQAGLSHGNTVVDCSMYNTGGTISTNCVGGTGSSSDHNNDGHVFMRIKQFNDAGPYGVFGANIGHSQSLVNQFIGCEFNAVYGAQCLTGGSFDVHGGIWGTTGYKYTFGGVMGRAMTFVGCTESDSVTGQIQARSSDTMSGLNLTMIGDHNDSGGSATNALLFDVTGSQFHIQAIGCFLAAGASPEAYLMNFKDVSGSATCESSVSFTDCLLGAYGGTADAVVISRIRSPWTEFDGLLHETVLNGGQWVGETGGIIGGFYPTVFERPFNRFGFVNSDPVITVSANYTVDSNSAALDALIRVNNASGAITVTLIAQLRKGRTFTIIALSTAHTITIAAPTTTPSSNVNGSSTFVWTPPAVGARLKVSLADTVSSGVLTTWDAG
jgi:hypothetical protein